MGDDGMMRGFRMTVVKLKAHVDSRFTRMKRHVDHRFAAVDTRFNEVDARFKEVDARFDAVDARFNAVDAQFAEVNGASIRSAKSWKHCARSDQQDGFL
jgi:uncharacterized protein YdcH (DUF465 family)